MGYCIMRNEKVKTMQVCGGLEREHNREESEREKYEDKFSPGIDWDKTNENIYLIKNKDWKIKIKEEIKKHGIEKYRKDSVMIDSLYTTSPETMKKWDKETLESYFVDCLNFHERHYGVVLNAVIHMDESNPHLHVDSVPLVRKEDGTWKLCAKDLIGNRATMSKHQSEFYSEVGKKYGLSRGVEKSRSVHNEVSRWQTEKLMEQKIQIDSNEEYLQFQQDEIKTRENLNRDLEERIELNQGVLEDQRERIERQNIQIEKGNEMGKKLQKELDEKQRENSLIEVKRRVNAEYDRMMEEAVREANSRWDKEVEVENTYDYER